MKVLLVQPGHYDFRTGRLGRSSHKRGLCPSFILPYLAAFFPKDAAVTLIDETLTPVDFSVPYDLVGISVKTPQAKRAYEIAAEFRRRGVPVVLGGYHVNLCPDEASEKADCVVIGEIETVWEEFFADFLRGTLKPRYQSSARFSMQKMKFPRFDLLDLKRYSAFYGTKIPLETSRGCIHHCSYCSTPEVYQNGIRFRPVDDVVDDIKRFRQEGPFVKKPLFVFIDDNLTASRERALKLFEALTPLRIRWSGYFTVQACADRSFVKLAARSGCYSVFVGLESVNALSLRAARKEFNVTANFSQAVRTLQEAGIILVLGMILGFPEDSAETFERTKRFLADNPVPVVLLHPLYPFPGTLVYEQLRRGQKLLDEKFWLKDHNPYELFRHGSFSRPGALQKGMEDVLSELMSLRSIYRRSRALRQYSLPLFAHNLSMRVLLQRKGVFAFT